MLDCVYCGAVNDNHVIFNLNKKGTPRTRQSSLTLAAFPPWGSSQDGRRAKSSPHINPQRHIFPPAKQNLPVRWENSPPYGRNIPIINVVRGLFLSMPMTSGRLAHRSADFRCVPRLEDSTSGLCHTPGTRAGSNTLVGSNPTSSATEPSHPVRTGRLGFSHTQGFHPLPPGVIRQKVCPSPVVSGL